MPFAVHGFGHLDSLREFGRTQVANGRMIFGRIFGRIAASSSNFKVRARAPGSSNAILVLRVELIIALWRMIAPRESRFTPNFDRVCTPPRRLPGSRLTRWSLHLTQWTFLGGMTEIRICYIIRIPSFLGHVRSGGKSA